MEEKYDLALKIKARITQEQISLILCLFKDKHFSTFLFKTQHSYILFLKYEKICPILKEAEHLRIQKEKIDLDSQSPSPKNTQNFMKNALNRNVDKNLNLISTKIKKFENYETISPSTVYKFIKNCPVKIEDFDSISNNLHQSILDLFSSSELVRIKYSIINKLRLFDLNIIDFLNQQKLLLGIFPLYDNDKITQYNNSIDQIYGEKVLLYFEFIKHYIKWLTLPSLIGLITIVWRYFDNNSFHFLLISYAYSFFITIWFTVFLISWQRKQNEINTEYGSYGKIFLVADKNSDFKASERMNLKTGIPEEHYSKYRRYFFYFISVLEAIPFLLLGLCIKIVFLTLKGFISPGEYFYFETVGAFVKESSPLHGIVHLKIILDIFQIEATSKVNFLYKIICRRSTKRENHRTNQAAENSYALKRFCFEFLNRFLHLGYIAYVKMDFATLINELTIIFTLDEIRRVLLESFIPLIYKKYSKKRIERQTISKAKKEEMSSYIAEKILELNLPNYDNFDDYLEIIIQFCYLTLFAGVFPQAAYMSLCFTIIEYYSDRFKLTNKLYRRPLPSKASGIGCWMWLMNFLSFVCVFSNSFLFAFNYFNYYYSSNKRNAQVNEEENEYESKHFWENILLTILITEHILLIIILLMRYFIKNSPKWVRIFLKRQEKQFDKK